jgi:exodeoxyribonuclease VII small subunit
VAEPKFEKDLEKLESIVQSLEEGGLSLDESLKKFEEGMKLRRRCEKALGAAEKKIELLTKDEAGATRTQPFTTGESDEADNADAETAADSEAEDDGELLF